ncbi:MAG: hypothetical protein R3258_05360 [Acidimicrobiia bacterium]|nr:hypothetical protein [Acidimicrobiia bacterium]
MGAARPAVRWLAATLVLAFACAPSSGTVRGIVVEVDGSFEDVVSFTVLVEGERLDFIPVAGVDYAFPLPHLRDHLRSGEPVVVGWEVRDGERVALSVEDG